MFKADLAFKQRNDSPQSKKPMDPRPADPILMVVIPLDPLSPASKRGSDVS